MVGVQRGAGQPLVALQADMAEVEVGAAEAEVVMVVVVA